MEGEDMGLKEKLWGELMNLICKILKEGERFGVIRVAWILIKLKVSICLYNVNLYLFIQN